VFVVGIVIVVLAALAVIFWLGGSADQNLAN
jgi:hypothetical protein